MKKFLSELNIGKYVIMISIVGLIIMTLCFIIDIFIMKLYHGLHPLLWIVLTIISIIVNSKNAKNKTIGNISLTIMYLSLIAIMIDIIAMFVRLATQFPVFCVICGVFYILLLMVDSWWFDEKPWYVKEQEQRK